MWWGASFRHHGDTAHDEVSAMHPQFLTNIAHQHHAELLADSCRPRRRRLSAVEIAATAFAKTLTRRSTPAATRFSSPSTTAS